MMRAKKAERENMTRKIVKGKRDEEETRLTFKASGQTVSDGVKKSLINTLCLPSS